MKSIKRIIYMIMFFMLILVTNVYADTFELQTSIKEKSLYEGEEFSVMLRATNINSQNGIYGIQGILDYDETAIESIKIEGLNNWTVTYNDKDDSELRGTFVLANITEGIKQDQDVAKITIKMKTNIQFENTAINITNIRTSDGTEDISTPNTTLNIHILEKETNDSKNGNNNNNANNNANNNNNNNTSNINKNRKSNSTQSNNKYNSQKKNMPKLGAEDNIFIVIIIFAVNSLILYLKYKKYEQL